MYVKYIIYDLPRRQWRTLLEWSEFVDSAVVFDIIRLILSSGILGGFEWCEHLWYNHLRVPIVFNESPRLRDLVILLSTAKEKIAQEHYIILKIKTDIVFNEHNTSAAGASKWMHEKKFFWKASVSNSYLCIKYRNNIFSARYMWVVDRSTRSTNM